MVFFVKLYLGDIMQRYFVKEKVTNSDLFILSSDDSHHIKNVMRMNLNDEIEVVYNGDVCLCEIVDVSTNIKAKIISEIESDSELSCHVTIAQSLLNEQKMDFILQKTCELGVSEIIPLQTARSIINLKGKEEKKLIRWNKIVKEASEQSKRSKIPTINNVMSLKDLINLDYDYKLLCAVNEMTTTIKKVLSKVKTCDKILFVIGPEGGFSKEEEQLLIQNGFISVSFGSRVLRSETAGIYIMSLMNYILME